MACSLIPKAYPFKTRSRGPAMNNKQDKPMTDSTQAGGGGKPEGTKNQPPNPKADHPVFRMTLEEIIDASDEFEHLNELVVLHIKRSGGLKNPDDYFTVVTPILDILERKIRMCSVQGITQQQMKLIIQDWIDMEIAEIK
jgi:hypothetical protein